MRVRRPPTSLLRANRRRPSKRMAGILRPGPARKQESGVTSRLSFGPVVSRAAPARSLSRGHCRYWVNREVMKHPIFNLLAIAALAAAPGKQTFTGIITDDVCAKADHS